MSILTGLADKATGRIPLKPPATAPAFYHRGLAIAADGKSLIYDNTGVGAIAAYVSGIAVTALGKICVVGIPGTAPMQWQGGIPTDAFGRVLFAVNPGQGPGLLFDQGVSRNSIDAPVGNIINWDAN